ncbi:Gfo/Idh/MocA family oxidoreductase [Singulisphaera sp. Ch08]|uniref:Gfo/Idh/MocA family oxidoreductase n=1 Tax=Singulisphaera sp. Ch08 TaxID=3120278 RepID=A0AAU7CP49_9BACT
MGNTTSLARQVVGRLRQEVRRRYLEAGEAGWGKPAPGPARLLGPSASQSFRVGVIGAGPQGLAQCQGLQALRGVEIAGIADINPARLSTAGGRLGLPAQNCFEDAAQWLEETTPLDLLCVATTAPTHVMLGRVGIQTGAKRILLEKPIDVSLHEARGFVAECRGAGIPLAVNYSRRWMPDYRAIKRCIGKGVIGAPRSLAIILGKGELAMHGSHFFDLSRYLLGSEPEWVVAHLEPPTGANSRGANFEDPAGFCLFSFQNGARAYFDFSSDLQLKDPFLTIKGTLGRITVDEPRQFWTFQSRSQRVWTVPFVEAMKASTLFARVAAELLSDTPPASEGADGVAALEMILAAHLSHRRGHQPVTLPLASGEADLGLEFP